MVLATSQPAGNTFRQVDKKAALPKKARIRVHQVIAHLLAEFTAPLPTNCKRTTGQASDLSRLNRQLMNQPSNSDVLLYGYELRLLLSFLLEQEKQCSSGILGLTAKHSVRAEIRGLLPHLRAVCRQVDLMADRPINKQ